MRVCYSALIDRFCKLTKSFIFLNEVSRFRSEKKKNYLAFSESRDSSTETMFSNLYNA